MNKAPEPLKLAFAQFPSMPLAEPSSLGAPTTNALPESLRAETHPHSAYEYSAL